MAPRPRRAAASSGGAAAGSGGAAAHRAAARALRSASPPPCAARRGSLVRARCRNHAAANSPVGPAEGRASGVRGATSAGH
eukprot:73506-Prymnesium_polylepis.1